MQCELSGKSPLPWLRPQRHAMLPMPVAEGATAAAAGRARNAAGAFQARQGQPIALPAAAAAPAAPALSRFRQLCSLAAATCFLPLPHSANTHLALAMHLAHLILTVFLAQLLGKSCLSPKPPFLFFSLSSENSQAARSGPCWDMAVIRKKRLRKVATALRFWKCLLKKVFDW